jgi:hypothetical protein
MPASRFRRRFPVAVLGLWIGLMVPVGSALMARHLIALPRPAERPRTAMALAALRRPDDRGAWLVAHVLFAGCRCSSRVIDHIASAPPPLATAGGRIVEVALFVGHDIEEETRLAAAGLRVVSVEAFDLESRFDIRAAPILAVIDPEDRLRYAGGYTAAKQSYEIQDRRILASLLTGNPTTELPVFGCAVSAELRASLNPLRVPLP